MISIRIPVSLAAVVFPSLLLLAGCRSANNLLERGNAAFHRGQFEEASLNYRKAVQKDANFGEAYHQAAQAELKLNKAAEALQDLREAVRLMPDNQAAREDLTNLMLGAYIGDPAHPKFLYDLLVQSSTAWLQGDPNSIQALRVHGYLAMLERSPEEAVEVSRRAHQAHPRDEKVADGLMDALFRANQPSEAEKVGLDFLATDSAATDIYDALFRMYVAAHRVPDVDNILTRKVDPNPRQISNILHVAGF